MENFTINFYAPIAINTLHYEPLFTTKHAIELEEFQILLKKTTGISWRLVEDINKTNKKIELEFPFKIEFDQCILFSQLPNPEIILTPQECMPFTLSDQKVTFSLYENGTAVLNYIALFKSNNSFSPEHLKKLHSKLMDKFSQPEKYMKPLFDIGKNIKESVHLHSHTNATHVTANFTLSELFPWQYILYFFENQSKPSKMADIAQLLYENESNVYNISTHSVREIFLSWHAATVFTEMPVKKDSYEILAYSLLFGLLCGLWQEVYLLNKLLAAETTQLLTIEPKNASNKNIIKVKKIRSLTENVLCKARAFNLHFSWEYINVIKMTKKKWLFDNIIEAIINRRSTINIVYDNLKDELADKRHTRLGLIGIFFTILTSITMVTGVTAFLVKETALKLGHNSRLFLIIGAIVGIFSVLILALPRIRGK